MAEKNFEALLEYIVNGEQAKAEELFHQLVVAKSREIYENLLEEEMKDEEDLDEASEEDDEEEELDEAAEEDDEEELDEAAEDDDEEMDEMFNMEADDEEGDDDGIGGNGDASDMEDELGPDGETDDDGMEFGDHDEDSEEARFDRIEDALDELKSKFDQLLSAEEHEEEENPDIHGGMLPDDEGEEDMGDEDESMMMPFEEEIEAIDLSPAALMREYVDKVGGDRYEKFGKMGDNGANAKSVVAGKNDMGGTTANIARGGEAKGEGTKGGLLNPTTKLQDGGNVNKPGGTNVKQFYKNNNKGHGAEKKGAGEVGGTDKKSIIGK
jgi:hypothetical protein